jgi:hypothetical protein
MPVGSNSAAVVEHLVGNDAAWREHARAAGEVEAAGAWFEAEQVQRRGRDVAVAAAGHLVVHLVDRADEPQRVADLVGGDADEVALAGAMPSSRL